MGPSFALLLLPTLVCASIKVHIKASATKGQVSAIFNGTDSKVISDDEIRSFNLTDSNLKAGIKSNEGTYPTDVFVRSPTKWGDLYKSYNWSEVRRYTEIKKIKIISVNTEKVTLVEQKSENKLTTGNAVFSADVSDGLAVIRSVRKSYIGKMLSANAEYDIEFDIGLSPAMHMKLISHLNTTYELQKSGQKVQAESDVKFSLKPLQAAELVLNATKVTIEVSVDYESSLNGYVATNFYPRHKDHHFWAYNVGDVMNATNDVSPIQKSSDLLTVMYFTDLCVYVTDLKTGEEILSVPYDYVLGDHGEIENN